MLPFEEAVHVRLDFTCSDWDGTVIDDELKVRAHELVDEPQVLVRVPLVNKHVEQLK